MNDHPTYREPNDPNTRRESFARAVDDLVESGFIPDEDSKDQHALAGLLRLLDLPERDSPNRDLLINVTVARLARQREDDARIAAIRPDSGARPLTAESARAIDEVASTGWETPGTTADEHARSAADLLSTLELPDGISENEREALVGRTLDAIQTQIDENQRRFRMDPARDLESARPRVTLSDITAVAAMVMIAGAIIWPLITGLREASNERLCARDLSQAGMAFAMYANDHDDRLPSRRNFAQAQSDAREREADRPWWAVGESLDSHSANLFTLVRGGYTSMASLSCPGNEHAPIQATREHQKDWSSLEEVSYSYQIFEGTPPRLSASPRMVVLADKSPIIPRARLGEPFDPEARSLNHGGRGQNILMSDLSVVFTKEPYRPGTRDNIWLPRDHEIGRSVPLTGTETPADPLDAFVGP